MRSTGLICAVAAMAGALGAVSVGSAEAAVPGGCTSRGNYHAGATSAYNSSVYGARARIEYNNPDLCGSDTNGGSASVVWSMVTAHSATYPSNSSRNGWAQSGYGQFAQAPGFSASGFHVFTQYTLKCKNTGTCPGSVVRTKFGGTVTVTHYYENYVRASDGRIHMGVDGTQLDATNYNPAGDWDSDYAGQFAGEVIHPQSDVPGTSSDVTTFDHIQKYSPGGAINFFANIDVVTSSYSRHRRAETSPSSGGEGLSVWTSPVSSF